MLTHWKRDCRVRLSSRSPSNLSQGCTQSESRSPTPDRLASSIHQEEKQVMTVKEALGTVFTRRVKKGVLSRKSCPDRGKHYSRIKEDEGVYSAYEVKRQEIGNWSAEQCRADQLEDLDIGPTLRLPGRPVWEDIADRGLIFKAL